MSTDTRARATDPPLVEVGALLNDKYRIVRPLGHGGMGDVYEAQHTFLRRRFAIKFLRSEHLRSPEMIARFRREAQAAGQIENEHVAAVTDFGLTSEGTPYFVMEYLEGSDLGRVIARDGALTIPRATLLLTQACRGVAAAHANGIIHRDLKPDNLFICQRRDGTESIKVLDFGIAKLESAFIEDGLVTHTGAALGTPCYMSPEQARGEKHIDLRSDIYSLGAVLYEAITGERAHLGTSYNEIIYQIISREPVPVSMIRADVPAAVVAAIERAMKKEPSERYATADDFADALELTSRLRPFGLATEPAATAGVSPPPVALMPTLLKSTSDSESRPTQLSSSSMVALVTPAQKVPRRRAIFVAGLLALGILGGLILVFLERSRRVTHEANLSTSQPTSGAMSAKETTSDSANSQRVSVLARESSTLPSESASATSSQPVLGTANSATPSSPLRQMPSIASAASGKGRDGASAGGAARRASKNVVAPKPGADYDLKNPYEQ